MSAELNELAAVVVGWQHAIMCPIKKEKRWIYALYPNEEEARRHGQRHDLNTGKLLEDAADVRPIYAIPDSRSKAASQ